MTQDFQVNVLTRIDWILINTLVTLAETKSEDQWQSEPTRSKFT